MSVSGVLPEVPRSILRRDIARFWLCGCRPGTTELGGEQSLWIVFGCTLAFELFVLRRLRFDWITTLIVLAGTVLAIDYLAYTALTERNYDGPSHAAYIQFLGEHRRLPDLASCQFCAHPPLYYALAALWAEVLLVGGWTAWELGLQWFSLLLFFGSCVRSAHDSALTNRRMTGWLAALLVVLAGEHHPFGACSYDALASLLMIGSIHWLPSGIGATRVAT